MGAEPPKKTTLSCAWWAWAAAAVTILWWRSAGVWGQVFWWRVADPDGLLVDHFEDFVEAMEFTVGDEGDDGAFA